MRTKKAGRIGRDDSAGEDSDGARSDLDRLPDDSSSDEDVGQLAGGHAGLTGPHGVGPGGAHPYAARGDAGALQHLQAHGGMPVGSAAGRAAQPHGSKPHWQSPAPAQLPGGAKAATGHVAGPGKAGAAGSRRSAGAQAPRPAAAKEDPTVRRIKAQMRAVWLLQRDLPVPTALLRETKGPNATQVCTTPHDCMPVHPWSTYHNLVSTLCIAEQASQRAAAGPAAAEHASGVQQQLRAVGDGFVRGADGVQEVRDGLIEHLAERRAQRMKEHMKRRQEFLKWIPTGNMPPHVAERLDLERKQLGLYELQQEVRRALVVSHIDHGIPEPHQIALLKTSVSPMDGGILLQEESKEEWEQRMREAEEQRKLNRRKAFLQDMHKTHRLFTREHDYIRRCRDQICKAVKQWHRNAEKSKEKERSERLMALKSNDFEKYREFVKEAKNERLMELISKTDNYLASLAAKMSRTSKQLSATAETESLLELDHQILPLDAQNQEGAAQRPGDGGKEGTGGEGSNGSAAKEGSNGSAALHSAGQAQTVKQVEKIFEQTAAEVVIKQPTICGDGDDGLSKQEGKAALLLKPYQLQGVQWMATLYANNLSGILADEMGLGKTIQVIGLVTYVIESKNDKGPFLIIAPLSTITNWALEFQRWAPSLDVVVYKGSKETRKELFKSRIKKPGIKVVIVQYEMVMSKPDMGMLKSLSWSYMVVDEGHRLKNKDSKLFVVLTKDYQSRRKLILTGTPLQNNIGELWNLLNFLLPTVFDTDADFKTWFSKPFAQTDDEDEEEASQEEQMVLINRLHQVLRPFMLRRVKTDKDLCLSMPENREVVIKCTLSALQKIQYRQLSYATLRCRDEQGNIKTTSYNNTIMRLRQVCNHPYLMDGAEWDLGAEMRVRVCGKLDVLDRILPKLKEAGHRVLIYSQMVQLLEILAEYIEEQGYKYHKLIGATASDVRASMIEDFNKPDSDVFLFILSTRAGGQGVNLQSADTVIIFDSDWNPMMDEQAKARINRIGQTKQTLVIRLMTPGTVEEKMLSRANARLRMGDLVIEAGAFKVGASSKDAQALLREKLDQDGILADIAQIDQEVATDHDINELMMRTDHEFEMWRRMDEERLKNVKPLPRLMQEDEVPEHLLGERISQGDRVVLLDERQATVSKKCKGHEWQVEVDDGGLLTVHRTELMLAAETETEESYEAARLARRKVTKSDHSVSHHGLTDAEFTRCLEQGVDIDEFVRSKKNRAERSSGRVASKRAEAEDGGGGSSRKRDRSARRRSKAKKYGEDDDDEDDDEGEDDDEDDEGEDRLTKRRR